MIERTNTREERPLYAWRGTPEFVETRQRENPAMARPTCPLCSQPMGHAPGGWVCDSCSFAVA